jgi:hypothetical protein
MEEHDIIVVGEHVGSPRSEEYMAGEYRVIIAGSREMADYEAARKAIGEVLGEIGGSAPVRVVSGHCRGADLLGERYAREHGLELSVFPAEWNRYGRRAGFIRNTQMAEFASEEGVEGALIAFWDGESRGTMMMIGIAEKKGIDTYVFDLTGRKRSD